MIRKGLEHIGGSWWRCIHCGAQIRAECQCCEPAPCGCSGKFDAQVKAGLEKYSRLPRPRNGMKFGPDGAFTLWTVLAGALFSDEEALWQAEAFGIEAKGWQGGPGDTFRRDATIRRSTTRVLVSQSGGRDI
jgi:hypothetical protein